MYEFIEGEIAELNPAYVIIQTGGAGYFIHISLNTFTALNGISRGKLFTHFIVREDAHLLYGFYDKAERELFRNLLSVNGVGASTALMMLSSLSPDEITAAIAILTEEIRGDDEIISETDAEINNETVEPGKKETKTDNTENIPIPKKSYIM